MEAKREPISEANRAMLNAQLSRLAERCKMPPRTPQFLRDYAENSFERNRAYVKSGKAWLIREGIAWAQNHQDWVEVVYNEYGDPCDLEQ